MKKQLDWRLMDNLKEQLLRRESGKEDARVRHENGEWLNRQIQSLIVCTAFACMTDLPRRDPVTRAAHQNEGGQGIT